MKTLAVIFFTFVMAAGSRADTVIGNSLTNRGTTDSYLGQIFLLNANLNPVAGL